MAEATLTVSSLAEELELTIARVIFPDPLAAAVADSEILYHPFQTDFMVDCLSIIPEEEPNCPELNCPVLIS